MPVCLASENRVLFRCVGRFWFVTFSEPSKVLLVVRVGGIEGYEGVVGQALDALCGLAFKHWFDLLVHCGLPYSSADAVQ
jgi:hypothetical protein